MQPMSRGWLRRLRGGEWEESRQFTKPESIVNNSGYLYRLFHPRTKYASLESHVYVSHWLLRCHQPKYLQDPLRHVLSWPDQDDIFRQDLIHCCGS